MSTRPTSAWANRVRSHQTARRQRAAIVACLLRHGPLTREYIGKIIGLPGDSLRPRVRELLRSRSIRVLDSAGITACGNKAERLAVRK